jgi:hypothetical protein
MAKAIARHHDSLIEMRSSVEDVRMASTIHDALIDEARDAWAERALMAMKQDMVAGYLDVFPGAPTERLVEGGIGPSWGELAEIDI